MEQKGSSGKEQDMGRCRNGMLQHQKRGKVPFLLALFACKKSVCVLLSLSLSLEAAREEIEEWESGKGEAKVILIGCELFNHKDGFNTQQSLSFGEMDLTATV